jgi:hypothetical protein
VKKQQQVSAWQGTVNEQTKTTDTEKANHLTVRVPKKKHEPYFLSGIIMEHWVPFRSVNSRSTVVNAAPHPDSTSSSSVTVSKKSVRSQSCQAYPLSSAAKIQTMPVFIQPERPTSKDKKVQTPVMLTADLPNSEKPEFISREVQACLRKRNQHVQTDADGLSASIPEHLPSVSFIIEKEFEPQTQSQNILQTDPASCAFCGQRVVTATSNDGKKGNSSVCTSQSSEVTRKHLKTCAQQTDLGGDVKQVIIVERGETFNIFISYLFVCVGTPPPVLILKIISY